jgi:hypothetical protein
MKKSGSPWSLPTVLFIFIFNVNVEFDKLLLSNIQYIIYNHIMLRGDTLFLFKS